MKQKNQVLIPNHLPEKDCDFEHSFKILRVFIYLISSVLRKNR